MAIRQFYATAPEPQPSFAQLPMVHPLESHPIWQVPAKDTAVLFCHFNPCGFQRPVWNMGAFLTGLLVHGVPAYGVELSFGGEFRLPDHPRVLRLAGEAPRHLLFQKEALWNAVEKIVPDHVDNLVFLDADLVFRNPRLVQGIEEGLRSHKILQPFSHCMGRDKNGRNSGWHGQPGKFYAATTGLDDRVCSSKLSHPGFGLAIRRRAFREMGGFYAGNFVGDGDAHATLSALGLWERSAERGLIPDAPRQEADKAAARIFAVLQGRAGFVAGDVEHLWHGHWKNRGYVERKTLYKHYEPGDLETEPSGLVRWSDRAMEKTELMTGLADYFLGRKEDT